MGASIPDFGVKSYYFVSFLPKTGGKSSNARTNDDFLNAVVNCPFLYI